MYMLPAVVDPSGLQHFCDRAVDGISAVFLALKRRPIIRYSRTSDISKRIAHEASVSTPTVSFFCLNYLFLCLGLRYSWFRIFDIGKQKVERIFLSSMLQKLMYQQESGLFDFRRTEISPLLLIIDRRDDPVTPLLNQWTFQVWLVCKFSAFCFLTICASSESLLFPSNCASSFSSSSNLRVLHNTSRFYYVLQAMVHELIGIEDNKVNLKNVGKLPKDQQVKSYFLLNLKYYLVIVSTMVHLLILCAFRRLYCHLSKMHFSKQICTRTSEILE